MIKNVFYDGKPKDKRTEEKVDQILNKLDGGEKMYIIGVDYAAENSKDYTGVAYFTENEDGSKTLEGFKYA